MSRHAQDSSSAQKCTYLRKVYACYPVVCCSDRSEPGQSPSGYGLEINNRVNNIKTTMGIDSGQSQNRMYQYHWLRAENLRSKSPWCHLGRALELCVGCFTPFHYPYVHRLSFAKRHLAGWAASSLADMAVLNSRLHVQLRSRLRKWHCRSG
jgi:hypothetical protein